MKLITHIIFSFMLVYLISTSLGYSYLDSVELATSTSIIINYVIDAFDHEEFHGHIRRNKITHSLSTASVLGVFKRFNHFTIIFILRLDYNGRNIHMRQKV